MKHLPRLLHCTIFIVFTLGSTCSLAQVSTLEEVRQSVQSDLEESLANLTLVRDEIAAEKLPLVSELNSTESEIRELRREVSNLQSIRDSRELSLIELESSIQAWENENLYILNLLDEYATRFQTNLDLSEMQVHSDAISAYRNSSRSQSEQETVNAQVAITNIGLDRIRNSLGGSQYEGSIVVEDGSLYSGTFSKFGPVVYFIGADRVQGGIVTAEEGLYPKILNLNSDLDALTQLANGISVEVPVDMTEGVVAQLSSNEESLLGQIGRGGIWIVPILFFAVLSLGISVFKAAQILRIKMPSTEEVRGLLRSLRESQPEKAASIAEAMPEPAGSMLRAGVQHRSESPELLEEIMYENILDARPALNRLLPIIATTAAVAPLLGLLGTVTGMINTFNLIAIFGTGDSRVLSSGISEALVTTEFGLIVAIPALLIHALLSRRIKTILADMEKFALIFTNGVSVPAAVHANE